MKQEKIRAFEASGTQLLQPFHCLLTSTGSGPLNVCKSFGPDHLHSAMSLDRLIENQKPHDTCFVKITWNSHIEQYQYQMGFLATFTSRSTREVVPTLCSNRYTLSFDPTTIAIFDNVDHHLHH
jgi:hypothetical protein